MTTIMGAQNKDPAVVGSSIALLQERFKQLQRLKEMREQRRELLNLLPDQTSDGYDEPSKTVSMRFSPSDDQQAPFQYPLALGLNSHAHQMPQFQITKPHRFPSASRGTHTCYERPDVDTSLRL